MNKHLTIAAVLALLPACSVVSPPSGTKAEDTRFRTYSSDEYDVRMAVYERHIPDGTTSNWYVDESERFVQDLDSKRGMARIKHVIRSTTNRKGGVVDIQTREGGYTLNISAVEIAGRNASVQFVWYAGPLAAGSISITLVERNGRWVVHEWKEGPIASNQPNKTRLDNPLLAMS